MSTYSPVANVKLCRAFGEHMISKHKKFKTLVNVVVREVLGSIEKTHDKLALNPKFNCDECGYRATYQSKKN
jgi:hypothetical protein